MMFLTRRAWNAQAHSHGVTMRAALSNRTSLSSLAATSTLIVSAPDNACAAATLSGALMSLINVRLPSVSYVETASEPERTWKILYHDFVKCWSVNIFQNAVLI